MIRLLKPATKNPVSQQRKPASTWRGRNNGTNYRTKWRSLRPAPQTGEKKFLSAPRLGESAHAIVFPVATRSHQLVNQLLSYRHCGSDVDRSTALPLVFRA